MKMPMAPQLLYSQLWKKRRKQVCFEFSLKCSQALWRRHFLRPTVPSFCCTFQLPFQQYWFYFW